MGGPLTASPSSSPTLSRVGGFGVQLRVALGEILGFAGLPGSGAEEALDLLFAGRPF